MSLTPTAVSIELTLWCNQRCLTCFADASVDRNAPEFPRDRLLALIEEMAACGTRSLTLEGGEPTLYPHLFDAIEQLRRTGIACAIATNGTRLSAGFCKRLRASGIRHNVYVSIDGPDAVSYERVRRSPHFDRVIANIANLRKNGIRFAVSCVIVRDNVDHIGAMYNLASSLGASFLNLIRFNLEGRGIEHRNVLSVDPDRTATTLRAWVQKTGGLVGFFGENYILPVGNTVLPSFVGGLDMRESIAIKVDGQVRLGRASCGPTIGNCITTSFADVVSSPSAERYHSMGAPEFIRMIQESAARLGVTPRVSQAS